MGRYGAFGKPSANDRCLRKPAIDGREAPSPSNTASSVAHVLRMVAKAIGRIVGLFSFRASGVSRVRRFACAWLRINQVCRRPGCELAPRSRLLAISVPSMHTRNINCESPGVSVSRTNCVSLNFLLQRSSASAPKRLQIMSRAIRSSKCRVANCAPFSWTSSRPAMRKYVASQESSTSVSMRASKPGWSTV